VWIAQVMLQSSWNRQSSSLIHHSENDSGLEFDTGTKGITYWQGVFVTGGSVRQVGHRASMSAAIAFGDHTENRVTLGQGGQQQE
jgi:hypothetical protein